jgi:hypothetical protein
MAHIYTQDGKLWQEGHPLWPNKTDGTPYKRIPAKVKEIMEADGTWPDLFKSVTTYLKYTKGQAIAGWQVATMLESCVKELQEEAGKYSYLPGAFISNAQARYKATTNKPSDDGTAIHDAVEKYLSEGVHPDDQIAMNACIGVRALLENTFKLNISDGLYEYGFAGEFKGIPYGGTIDAIFDGAVFDWKTTGGRKSRLPYPDQPAQIAAYAAAVDGLIGEGHNQGYNVYIDRETGRVYAYARYDYTVLSYGWSLFACCYLMDETLEWIKENARLTKV